MSIFKRTLCFCLTLVASLLVLCGNASPAYAHRPHDVVSEVELSPEFGQDSTLYILVRNGLFRSKNTGDTWKRLSNGLDYESKLIALEISPSDKNILYVGEDRARIYRSDDGGDSWVETPQRLENQTLDWLQIAPNTPETVFAHTEEGVLFKTSDGGETWSSVLENSTATALAAEANGQVLILGDDAGNLQKSEDGGETWAAIATFSADTAIQQIAFSPNFASDQTFLIATTESGIYRTVDGGKSIDTLNQGLADLKIQDVLIRDDEKYLVSTWDGGYWSWQSDAQSWIQSDLGLTRDPMADDLTVPHFEDLEVSGTVAFLGGFDGLFRSTNSGEQWEEVETLSLGSIVSLAVSPTFADDNTLAVATYVGEIYISRDRGETWQPANESLYLPKFKRNFDPLIIEKGDQDPRRFFDIALSGQGTQGNQLLASLLYTKILRSDKMGESWSITNLDREVRGVALTLSPDFEHDQTVFSRSQSDLVYRSTNAGKTFQQVGAVDKQQGNDAPSTVLSPDFAQDKTLFTTGELGVYRSTDGGESWTTLTEGNALDEDAGIQLAISSNFAADKTLFAISRAGLYRSINAGDSWENITSKFLNEPTFMEAIAISPNYAEDRTVIVSPRGRGLFKSTDGGETFSAIGDSRMTFARMTNVPSAGRPLQFSPNYAVDKTLFGFGAAETEIYRSIDDGESWEALSIPRQQIMQIPPPSLLANAGMFLDIHQGKIKKLAVLLFGAIGLIGGLQYFGNRGLMTALRGEVQSFSADIVYGVPKALKLLTIALIGIRLVFALGSLSTTPYNADEVRGFYRLSGYLRAEVIEEVFRGDIFTKAEVQSYQVPSSDKNVWDALVSLADYPEHPPLYDVIARYGMTVWKNPLSARVLALVLSFVYLPLAYWLCLELFHSAWAGWIAVALLSISPYHILLAQGAREYSLWTILILGSSTLLLKAIRTQRLSYWMIYAATVAIGLYSHLFFAFSLIAQSIYMLLFYWRQWKTYLIPFVMSAGAGVLAFGPWALVVLLKLDKIDENTQWVQGRRSSIVSIIRTAIDSLGNTFFDLDNSLPRWENYSDFLFFILTALAVYCLIRWSPKRVSAFVLLPVIVTTTILVIPDVISGGGRFAQSRYLVPTLLSLELVLAYFISNAMRNSKYNWERLAWSGVFSLSLLFGTVSGMRIAKSPNWDYLDQGNTASVKNLELAPIINAAKKPLIISTATHSFLLALSYEVDDHVDFQLLQGASPEEWSALLDISKAQQDYSDIFIYGSDQEFFEFLLTTYGLEPEAAFEHTLYKLPES